MNEHQETMVDMADDLMRMTIEYKVDAHRNGEDFMSTIFMQAEGQALAILPWPLENTKLAGYMELVREESPWKLLGVTLVSDAYMRMGKDLPLNMRRGQLEQDFEAGDMAVVEALTLTAVEPGRHISIIVQYKINDDGELVFEEPIKFDTDEGLVLESLQRLWMP